MRPWRGYTRLMPTVVSFAVGLGPSRAVPSAPGRHSCITPRSPAQARPFGSASATRGGVLPTGATIGPARSRGQHTADQGPEGAALFEPASGPAGGRPWQPWGTGHSMDRRPQYGRPTPVSMIDHPRKSAAHRRLEKKSAHRYSLGQFRPSFFFPTKPSASQRPPSGWYAARHAPSYW